MLLNFLRKIGICPPAPPTDKAYYEAHVDDAMMEREKVNERLSKIAEANEGSNKRLKAGIDRIKMSSRDDQDVMAELIRGMKGGH